MTGGGTRRAADDDDDVDDDETDDDDDDDDDGGGGRARVRLRSSVWRSVFMLHSKLYMRTLHIIEHIGQGLAVIDAGMSRPRGRPPPVSR